MAGAADALWAVPALARKVANPPMTFLRPVTLVAGVLLAAGSARADLVMHLGSDPGAGPGQAASIAATAEAEFTAAVGPTALVNLESAPLGGFTTLDLGQGVSATLSGTDTTPPPGFIYGIAEDNPNSMVGYNATAGGSRFLRFTPELGVGTARLTFDFALPVDAVALTITGLGLSSGPLYAVFGPGPGDEREIAGSSLGGRIFLGLSGLDDGITQLRLELRNIGATSRDVFAVDDLRFRELVGSAAVPEPSTLLLAAVGLGAAGALRARRRWGR